MSEKRNEEPRVEEKYKALIETAADAIFTLDLLGRFTFVNPAAERISGYSEEELVGKHFRELLPAKYIPACLNVFQKALRGQPTPPIEIELVTKEGKRVPLELLGRAVKRGRRVVEIIGIARDITERKRAEEARRESEEKYRNLVERANDGITIIQDTIIRYANPRLVEMWGGTVQEVIGTPFTDHVHPDELPKVVDRYKRRIAGKDVPPIYETVLRRKDGSKLYAELNAGIITYQGKSADLVIVRDITERKRVEREIRRHHDELAALNAIAMAVTSTLDLQEVLRTIQERVVTLLGEKYPPVFGLFDERNQTFEVVATRAHNEIVERAERLLGVKVEELTFPLSTVNSALREALLAGKPYVTDDISDLLGPQVSRRLVRGAQRVVRVKCIVDFPLWVKGKFVGVMALLSQKERVPDEEMELLSSIASQAAIAIDNARLFNETQKRITELATFNEIGRTIASTIKLDQLWELMYHQTCRVMEVSAFYISLYDRENEKLNVVIDMLHGQRQPQEEGPRKFSKGRTEYIIRTKKPLLIRGEVQETYKRLGIVTSDKRAKGFAGVPITAGREVIGVLAVQNYERDDAYDEHTIGLLSTIADQAAIAIENARLYEETKKRLAETTVLHKVAEVINASLDLREVPQRVVEELSKAFGYPLLGIYLLEGDRLRPGAQTGYDPQREPEFMPIDRGVVGRVVRTGQPAFLHDVTQDPDYIPDKPETTTEICVPIRSGQTTLGVLNVESDSRRPLTEDDLQLLITLSSHIGVAIENARLYEKEQRRSLQRKTIAEVGHTIASILDLDTLLSQVADLIAQNFGYYHVHIFQVDPDSGYAIYKAGTGQAASDIAQEGFRLKVGEEGIIGWVAQHGEPLLANDVSLDPHYIPHPALPDTRSELAVPIHVGTRIIGVLDVQSTEVNAFDQEDLDTLQTLADQLAVAMENARLYHETQQLAITDGLTGLYNLRYFYETLEKEIQRSERYGRPVSLVILDIDGFKTYNDLYGHLAGDDLLKELAQLMSKVIRRTDTLARYGGEEFAIILPETETEGAEFLADRLLKEVRGHRFSIHDGRTTGRITISLGVATYPYHANSAKALVDAADKALLRAKGAGKNRLSVCVCREGPNKV